MFVNIYGLPILLVYLWYSTLFIVNSLHHFSCFRVFRYVTLSSIKYIGGNFININN